MRIFSLSRCFVATTLVACASTAALAGATPPIRTDPELTPAAAVVIGSTAPMPLEVGDVVFIRIGAKPFREVADATRSWTNHVGVVVDASAADPVIAESTFPLSRRTTWSAFVARSEGGRVSVSRLKSGLTPDQRLRVVAAADRRVGILYDTGFDLHSPRQFCSRYVREVLLEATGQPVGNVETFAQLLARRPDGNVGFWKLWYFGRIPLTRETVTPASVMESPALRSVYEASVGEGVGG